MTFRPKTIEQQIDCLARLSGASESFICQVKALFTKKGIPLDSDAAPYQKALEDAFHREEAIRVTSQRARKCLVELHENFGKIGHAYVKQVEQLRKIQSNLRDQARKLRKKTDKQSVTIRGDHRSYVTKPQPDSLPMVPGPEETQ